MNMVIMVTDENVGNDRRGYHDHRTTVAFRYEGGGCLIDERELEIVESIVTKKMTMWYSITKVDPHVYIVKHGYDSGD